MGGDLFVHRPGSGAGENQGAPPDKASDRRRRTPLPCAREALLGYTLLLGVGSALFCGLAPYPLPWKGWPWWGELLAFGGAGWLLVCVAYLAAIQSGRATGQKHDARVVLAGVAGFATGVFLYVAYRLLHGFYARDELLAGDYIRVRAAAAVTTFGPALVLFALVLGIFLGVGILKNRLREELREWWSSLCAGCWWRPASGYRSTWWPCTGPL